MSTGQDVTEQLWIHLGATIELSFLAMLLSLVVAIPLGILAAMNQRSMFDRWVVSAAMTGYSIPVFWLAQLLILLFAVHYDWFAITGQITPLYDIPTRTGAVLVDVMLSDSANASLAFWDAVNHMVLPVIVLAMMPLTMLIRIMRDATLDVLDKNYIKAARARGLSELKLMRRHALPNAMQPLIRQLGLQFSVLMTNALLTEVIFNRLGIGSWLVKSIYERDYPVLQSGLLVFASFILLINLLVELYHAWRYPQVRQELYAEY
ncbi:ABC transporter permease subunit [Idiomarina tyrosinivorans]|nr:ABC transporter permease subunit [Idiomarina tyrosinivorans]